MCTEAEDEEGKETAEVLHSGDTKKRDFVKPARFYKPGGFAVHSSLTSMTKPHPSPHQFIGMND